MKKDGNCRLFSLIVGTLAMPLKFLLVMGRGDTHSAHGKPAATAVV